MNFRNSDCATVSEDYIEMSTVQCVANTLFLTLEQVFGRIKSFKYVYVLYIYVDRKVLHEHFAPLQEVASLSQQERTTAVQWDCKEFSIE